MQKQQMPAQKGITFLIVATTFGVPRNTLKRRVLNNNYMLQTTTRNLEC